MSAVIRRNREGVLLNYGDPGELRDFYQDGALQPSDAARIGLLKAEHELIVLEVILQHLDVSDIATARIADALDTIRNAIEVKRRSLGMQSLEAVE
jgi:hypothetical protein